jgi:hypothetical protein
VLCVDPLLTAAHSRSCPALYQFLDFFLLNAHNAIVMIILGLGIISDKVSIFFHPPNKIPPHRNPLRPITFICGEIFISVAFLADIICVFLLNLQKLQL